MAPTKVIELGTSTQKQGKDNRGWAMGIYQTASILKAKNVKFEANAKGYLVATGEVEE
jgi:hypothetical protein